MKRALMVWLFLFAACDPAANPGGSDVDLGPGPDLLPSKAALAAAAFRDAFEAQDYAKLPALIAELEAVYRDDPTNGENTLLLGHANLWTLAEFGRDPKDPSKLPARATDATRYFGEAAALLPDDHRIEGWLGSVNVAIGNFTMNPTITQTGRQQIDGGVAAFPEFNLFVRALVDGQVAATDAKFAGAVEAMWKTLDLCAGEPVDRANPDFAKYLGRQTTVGAQRVCWNDKKAQHNFEGFFLYMGDLVVKAGDPATATRLYANAQRVDSYGTWPFRADLEARIAQASQHAAAFADADPTNDPVLAVQATTACAHCHAAR